MCDMDSVKRIGRSVCTYCRAQEIVYFGHTYQERAQNTGRRILFPTVENGSLHEPEMPFAPWDMTLRCSNKSIKNSTAVCAIRKFFCR